MDTEDLRDWPNSNAARHSHTQVPHQRRHAHVVSRLRVARHLPSEYNAAALLGHARQALPSQRNLDFKIKKK